MSTLTFGKTDLTQESKSSIMIKYSWKRINNRFDWKPHEVLQYFYANRQLKIPTFLGRRSPKPIRLGELNYYKGPCFLINPDDLLNDAKSIHDLYDYIELASRRNIFDYNIRRSIHLPKYLMPEMYDEARIINNPYLSVDDTNVYFKYEQEKTVNG